jgi:exopolysaccharide biosynthesis polyprenyl glycosylphosphotransferase
MHKQSEPQSVLGAEERLNRLLARPALPERRAFPLRRILMGVDLVMIVVGWTVGIFVVYGRFLAGEGLEASIAETLLILPVGLLLLITSGLYRRRICQVRAVEIARIGRVAALLGLFGLLLLVVAGASFTNALTASTASALSWFCLLTLERGVLREWILGQRANGAFGAPVLVVGGHPAATLKIAGFLADHPVLGFRVCGVLWPTERGTGEDDRFPWLGSPQHLVTRAVSSGVSGVVLDGASLGERELNDAVSALNEANLHVHISSGLRGIERRRITLTSLADETFMHVRPLGLERRQVIAKRALDVVGASLALLVAAPMLLVASVAIYLTDRGPVLYRQERVGHGGERFVLYKLRTMRVGADQMRAGLVNERQGPLFKVAGDPRVTSVGRFLRTSSIDELPQLFNVLEGTMSLVGPRPALPEEAAAFDEELYGRLRVKPGVTGLWQVEARDLPSFDLYRRYDLLYVQNWSFGVDLAVIARTVTVVVVRTLRALIPVTERRSNATVMD